MGAVSWGGRGGALGLDRWDIAVAETRTRSTTAHDGHEITLHDAVLRARKRP